MGLAAAAQLPSGCYLGPRVCCHTASWELQENASKPREIPFEGWGRTGSMWVNLMVLEALQKYPHCPQYCIAHCGAEVRQRCTVSAALCSFHHGQDRACFLKALNSCPFCLTSAWLLCSLLWLVEFAPPYPWEKNQKALVPCISMLGVEVPSPKPIMLL